MAVAGKHGITENTPKNTLLGAGTYFYGLKWDSASKKWGGTPIGATNGGGKISITGEYIDLEYDGALVLFKGQTVKQGGKASMEVSMAECTGENIKVITNFKEAASDAEGYAMFVDKPHIEEGDYLDDFGFVGKTADGKKDIIVIFESALCKSAFELEPKPGEQAVFKAVLDAYAENAGELDTLPVKIYYPTSAVV